MEKTQNSAENHPKRKSSIQETKKERRETLGIPISCQVCKWQPSSISLVAMSTSKSQLSDNCFSPAWEKVFGSYVFIY